LEGIHVRGLNRTASVRVAALQQHDIGGKFGVTIYFDDMSNLQASALNVIERAPLNHSQNLPFVPQTVAFEPECGELMLCKRKETARNTWPNHPACSVLQSPSRRQEEDPMMLMG
jgi:hypothetical protein